MNPLNLKSLLLVLILGAFTAINNNVNAQSIEFSGVKEMNNKYQIKFGVIGVQNENQLADLCAEIESLNGVRVKNSTFAEGKSSVHIECRDRITADQIRDILLRFGFDFSSDSILTNDKELLKDLRAKETNSN